MHCTLKLPRDIIWNEVTPNYIIRLISSTKPNSLERKK